MKKEFEDNLKKYFRSISTDHSGLDSALSDVNDFLDRLEHNKEKIRDVSTKRICMQILDFRTDFQEEGCFDETLKKYPESVQIILNYGASRAPVKLPALTLDQLMWEFPMEKIMSKRDVNVGDVLKSKTTRFASNNKGLLSPNICEGVAKALRMNMTLEQLDFSGVCVQEGTIGRITSSLKGASFLKKAKFAQIMTAEAPFFFDHLATNSTIECMKADYVKTIYPLRLAPLLAQSSGLKYLSLVCNQLTDDSAILIAGALKTNYSLQALDVSVNSFRAPGIAAFAALIRSNKSLRALLLCGNRFSDSGAELLGPALAQNSTIEILGIKGCDITQKGEAIICEGLKSQGNLRRYRSSDASHLTFKMLEHQTQLEQVSLAGAIFGWREVHTFAEWIRKASNLRKLSMPDSKWEKFSFREGWKAIRNNGKLTHMNFSGGTVFAEDTQEFGDAIKENTELIELNFEDAHVEEDSFAQMALALKDNSKIEVLTCQGINLAEKGMKALSAFMSSTPSLSKLTLSECMIRDDHITMLAEAMEKNPKLKLRDLYLNVCDCEDTGAISLAKVIRQDKSLQRLYLSANSIKKQGAIALAEAVSTSKLVTFLDLYDNLLNPDEIEEVAEKNTRKVLIFK